jgi:hypothetical protein
LAEEEGRFSEQELRYTPWSRYMAELRQRVRTAYPGREVSVFLITASNYPTAWDSNDDVAVEIRVGSEVTRIDVPSHGNDFYPEPWTEKEVHRAFIHRTAVSLSRIGFKRKFPRSSDVELMRE